MIIKRILHDPQQVKTKADSLIFSHKKTTTVTSTIIEEELSNWLCEMWRNRICITDDLIKEKGKNIQGTMRIEDGLTFSNGCIESFNRRHQFKSYRSHGEDGDTDESAIEQHLPQIRARLSAYIAAGIFNADEYGVHNLPPTQTSGQARLSGRKKQKHRFTVLGCCNANGTERMAPLTIGQSTNSGCFRGREVRSSEFE